MNALSEWLPDLYRYQKTELPKQKLILGAAIVTLVCFVAFAVNSRADEKSWQSLLMVFFYIQALIWMVAGASQTSSAISSERTDRTWDFQRLTPLTSLQTALGKLLGAPIFTLIMGALVIPWSFFAASGIGASGCTQFAVNQISLLALAFLCNSTALLVSSLNSVGGKKGSIALGPIFALIVLWIHGFATAIRYNETTAPDFTYYSVSVNATLFASGSAFLFGLWAFLAAKWRIGNDYLEPKRAWRNPAFLIFLAIYFGGLERSFLIEHGLVYLMFFIYGEVGAVSDDEMMTPLRWLRSFKEKSVNAINEMPLALGAWLTYLAIVVVTCSLNSKFAPFSLVLFCLRDLALLESSRLLKFKQAKVLVGIVIVMLYVIPFVLTRVAPAILVATLPMIWIPESANLGSDLFVTNVAMAALQAGLALGWLVWLERSRETQLRANSGRDIS